MRIVAAAMLLLALALSAQAQVVPPGTLGEITTSTAIGSEPLDALNETAVDVDVTIPCSAVLANPAATAVAFTVEVPDGMNFTADADDVTVGPAECAGPQAAASLEKTTTLTIAPASGSYPPGVEPITVFLNASIGADDTLVEGSEEISFSFAYVPCYSVTPGSRSFDVSGETFTFDVTMELCGNAPSMVMVGPQAIEGGSLSGVQLFDATPPATVTRTVTFTAPEGSWTSVNATTHFFTHYKDPSTGAGTGEQLGQDITWTFRNTGSGGGGGGDGDKDSPGIALAAIPILVAAAALLRRRL